MKVRKTLEAVALASGIGLLVFGSANHIPTDSPHQWDSLIRRTQRVTIDRSEYLEKLTNEIEEEARNYLPTGKDKVHTLSPSKYTKKMVIDIMNSNIKARAEADRFMLNIVRTYQSLNKRTEQNIIQQTHLDVKNILEANNILFELYAKNAGLNGEDKNCLLYATLAMCALTGRAAVDIIEGKKEKYEVEFVGGLHFYDNKSPKAHQWLVVENQVIDNFGNYDPKDKYIPLVGSKIVIQKHNKGTIHISGDPVIYILPEEMLPK